MNHNGGYGYRGGFGEFTPLYPPGPIGPAPSCGPMAPAVRLHQLPPDYPGAERPDPYGRDSGTVLTQALGFLRSRSEYALHPLPSVTPDMLAGRMSPALVATAAPNMPVGPQKVFSDLASTLQTELLYGWPDAQGVPLPRPADVLTTYLTAEAAQLGHAPDDSEAFVNALYAFHELAWMVTQVSGLRGFVVRRSLVSTGRQTDVAWRYPDEADGLFCPAGWVPTLLTRLEPSSLMLDELATKKAALMAWIVTLQEELVQAQVPPRSAVGRWSALAVVALGLGIGAAVLWTRRQGRRRRVVDAPAPAPLLIAHTDGLLLG